MTRPARGTGARGGAIPLVLAPLLWIPQAALLALGIGRIAQGGGVAAVLLPAAGVLVLGALRAGLDHLGGRLAFAAARAELSRLRAAAVGRLARVSPLDTRRPPSGYAASVIAEEAETITPYLARFQPARLRATVVPFAILVAVLPFSWATALALLIAMPVIPVFMALIGWRAQAASAARLVEAGALNAFLLDRLRGLDTIRGLGAVDLTAARLGAEAERFRDGTMAVLRIAFLSSAVLELFAALGVAMVAVWVGFHLLGQIGFGAWGGQLTLAQGLFILLLAPAFFEPLRELAAVWHDRAAGAAALAALETLGAEAERLPEGATGPAPAGAPSVRLRGLGYSYPGGAAALAGFDLSVAAGESIALTGPSGAGKSTLLALIAGLAEPASGDILLDGAPAAAARRRAGVAWLGQAPAIFAGSMARNVALGRPEIGPDAIAGALRFARLGEVAAARGAAPIGEGGRGLSGGEALRLAIARAAATPGVRLILADEPTAHLDAATAAEITEMLVALGRGRTMIVATHDPRLAGRLDRAVALSPGLEAAA
ncbi:MAG: thiol reductant ABC exporter subunit CydD [Rhodovulum sulfidophilum]|uniref:Thiol reductant ABC exporter subunit CydD n=1 Tax=Rhodovulum sulfidophilum TaxID=35806 RepID=A0A2W5N0Z8_RHOSU|nr:MAG: thiol reductant ABC exporter subunit CydD [Rhodovulum sulfidophilum]